MVTDEILTETIRKFPVLYDKKSPAQGQKHDQKCMEWSGEVMPVGERRTSGAFICKHKEAVREPKKSIERAVRFWFERHSKDW